MSESNKEVIRRAYDAMAKGDFDALADLIADDVVEHEAFPGLEPTKEGVIEFFRIMRGAFPDLRMNAEDMVAEGDKVFIRGTMTGTHRGEFMGMPATEKQICVNIADFMRVKDGKLAEHWGVTDVAAMMEQLGGSPS